MYRGVSPSLLSLVLLVLAKGPLGAQGTPDKPAQATPSETPAPPKPPVQPQAAPPAKAKAKAKPKTVQAKPAGDWKAMAASTKPDAKAQAAQARAQAKSDAAWKAKAADYAKRIDLNTASKEELKRVKGITDPIADKIIAGRPYLSKAILVTQNVIPMSLYQTIKYQIKVESKPAAGPVAK